MTDIYPQTRAQFSYPVRQIFTMLLVLGLSGSGVFLALPRVLPVFQANLYLNGFILFVFVVGVCVCFWQVFQLIGMVRWLKLFTDRGTTALGYASRPGDAPKLLTPLATLLGARGAQMQINALSARSILDSVAQRIEEARDISRYIVNLLIFLGLLGTFYGLATTVPAVVDVIRNLAPAEGEEGAIVFNRLMSGLESQLSGMGVAFASSLLGLAGSLVVGLLELFAGHGQTRFYRELEEWLSSITQIGFSRSDDSGQDGYFIPVSMDQLAQEVGNLQQMTAQSNAGLVSLEQRLNSLAISLESVVNYLSGENEAVDVLKQIAAGQDKLLVAASQTDSEEIDAEMRMRLRSIDVQMLRILEEISTGRQELLSVLHKEIDTALQMISGTALTSQGRKRMTGSIPNTKGS